jgi:hypothetical protein
MSCKTETVDQVNVQGKVEYHCLTCGHTNNRAIYFYKHKVWQDKVGELWHESAGVFVRNRQGKYLFFQRTEFPFALTIPAGHVDKKELPKRPPGVSLKRKLA